MITSDFGILTLYLGNLMKNRLILGSRIRRYFYCHALSNNFEFKYLIDEDLTNCLVKLEIRTVSLTLNQGTAFVI